MTQRPSSEPPESLRPALSEIQLAVFDVDGVLTDGSVRYIGDEEQQVFDVKDGQGLAWLRDAGIHLAWITGRGCRATERRAADFGVLLHMRSGPKQERLAEVQEQLGISQVATLAMGDDLPDLGLAQQAGIFCAPADARPEVLEAANWVTSSPGGRGAVREVCEALLKARGAWPPPGCRFTG